jgi:hypothetical protein
LDLRGHHETNEAQCLTLRSRYRRRCARKLVVATYSSAHFDNAKKKRGKKDFATPSIVLRQF